MLWKRSRAVSLLLISQVPPFVKMTIWNLLCHSKQETRQVQGHSLTSGTLSFRCLNETTVGRLLKQLSKALQVSKTSSKNSLKRKVGELFLQGEPRAALPVPQGSPLTGGVLPDAGWRSWCNLADPLQFPLTLGADLQADPGQFVFFQGEMSPERKRLSQEGNSLRTVHCINRTWPQVIYCWSLTKRLKIQAWWSRDPSLSGKRAREQNLTRFLWNVPV